MKLPNMSGVYSVVIVVAVLLLLDANRDYDSTDNHITKTRSGLSLYTDYGTGCQYLSTFFSMTPRLNEHGAPMCNTTEY